MGNLIELKFLLQIDDCFGLEPFDLLFTENVHVTNNKSSKRARKSPKTHQAIIFNFLFSERDKRYKKDVQNLVA